MGEVSRSFFLCYFCSFFLGVCHAVIFAALLAISCLDLLTTKCDKPRRLVDLIYDRQHSHEFSRMYANHLAPRSRTTPVRMMQSRKLSRFFNMIAKVRLRLNAAFAFWKHCGVCCMIKVSFIHSATFFCSIFRSKLMFYETFCFYDHRLRVYELWKHGAILFTRFNKSEQASERSYSAWLNCWPWGEARVEDWFPLRSCKFLVEVISHFWKA